MTSEGPLHGLRVVELGGIGPAPFCGMLLGDLGADVIRIARVAEAGAPAPDAVLHRNARSAAIDLKHPDGVAALLRVIDGADAVIEGFRPGVAERLGLGPDVCLARRASLVYGRMTGWGQEGPAARTPGHDINYVGLAGVLDAIRPADDPDRAPVPPANLVGDFGGGGMLLAVGLLAALLHARATGEGQVVDAAMVDGSALLLAMAYGARRPGAWQAAGGIDIVNGAAPFYRSYRCADGGHVVVGALEPGFFAELLAVLGLAGDPDFAAQYDRAAWPAMHARLAGIFAGRARDEWARLFDGTQACVTPVLTLAEAPDHPHLAARGTYRTRADGTVEPAPAPRFAATPTGAVRPPRRLGADTAAVLAAAGLADDEVAQLVQAGVVALELPPSGQA
ncbi:CaiB/BaiF CoA-transferase family protein [Luedemannella helvata]|uniref:CaiB/BaiF CoA transferase family protein n=1 Tax=Luedemannella helvata TaxID=349315 RepID=UPI0031DDF695